MRFIVFALAIAGGLFAQDPRQEVLTRVHALSAEIARLEDGQVAINLLTHFGRIVCKYDLPAATAVFAQAASKLEEAGRGPDQHERIRGIVLYTAAQCNPDLAEQLRTLTEAEDNDLARSALAVLPQAEALIKKDPARAAQVASSILPALPSMEGHQLHDFDDFLHELRAADMKQADKLYTQALSHFGAQPHWNQLQHLGNYVFGPPGMAGSSSSTGMDGVEVFNWSVQRDSVSDEMVKAYLQTVASALWNLDTKSNLRSLLGQQLAPYADRVAPQLAPAFREASDETVFDLSQHLSRDSTEDVLDGLVNSPDPRARVQGHLYQYRIHWKAKRFEEAREIAQAIEDDSIRAQLMRILEMEDAMAAIRQEDLTRATGIVAKMQPGVHQALLYLGLASAYSEQDPETARRMVDLAWHTTGKIEPTMSSRLLLACSADFTKLDPEKALTTLAEAVQAFNGVDQRARRTRRRPAIQVMGSSLLELVLGEDGWLYMMWPIRIEGHQVFHFSDALSQFADLDLDRVDAIVADLQDKELLAEARMYACELRLKRAFAGLESDNTIPSIPEK